MDSDQLYHWADPLGYYHASHLTESPPHTHKHRHTHHLSLSLRKSPTKTGTFDHDQTKEQKHTFPLGHPKTNTTLSPDNTLPFPFPFSTTKHNLLELPLYLCTTGTTGTHPPLLRCRPGKLYTGL